MLTRSVYKVTRLNAVLRGTPDIAARELNRAVKSVIPYSACCCFYLNF